MTDLPYNETDPAKRKLLADAIYGSSLAGALLVHPDYACIQALKFNNRIVWERYNSYTSNSFKSKIAKYAALAGNLQIYLEYFDPKYIEDWFDQDANEDFVANTKQIPASQIDQLRYLTPNKIANISKYGSGHFTPELIAGIKSLKGQKLTEELYNTLEFVDQDEKHVYKGLLRSNPKYDEYMVASYVGYRYLPADFFRRYLVEAGQWLNLTYIIKAVWMWNRWDLWSILLQYHDPRIVQVSEMLKQDMTLGYLSTITLSILYNWNPQEFKTDSTLVVKYGDYGKFLAH